jgi:HEAT repeat protein
MSLFKPNIKKLEAKRNVQKLIKILRKGGFDGERAAEALGRMGDAAALDALAAAVPNNFAAFDALVRLGDIRAIERIVCNQPAELDGWEITCIARLGDKAIPRLRAVATNPEVAANSYRRINALGPLSKIGTPLAVETLVACLADSSWDDLPQAIVAALDRCGWEPPRSAAEPLGPTELLRRYWRGKLQGWGLAGALTKLRSWPAWTEPMLREVLPHVPPEESLQSFDLKSLTSSEVELLALIPGDAVTRHLTELLTWDIQYQLKAVPLLAGREPLIAAYPLRRKLLSANQKIRLAAAKALATLNEPQWLQWVRGDEEDFRRLAQSDCRPYHVLVSRTVSRVDGCDSTLDLEALKASLSAAPVELLEDMLRQDEVFVAPALADCPDPRASDLLLSALQRHLNPSGPYTGTEKVPPALLAALAVRCERRALGDACVLAAHLDPEVRLAAARLLMAIGGPTWAAAIKGDFDDFTRLGNSGDSRLFAPMAMLLSHKFHASSLEGHAKRMAIAQALVALAKACPQELATAWPAVRERLAAPHDDVRENYRPTSSDCSHEDHHVDGGGLEMQF